MSNEQPTPPPVEEEEDPEAVINAQNAMRLLLGLLAVWTFFSGLALIFFHSNAGATIGGGEGAAAQRLLGVHLLVLAPIYALIAIYPKRYRMFLWVPYAAQGGVVAVTLFDIVTGKRDFLDGALPLIVASIFLVLLVYVWQAARRPEPAAGVLPESVERSESEELPDAAEEPEAAEQPAGSDDSEPA